MEISKSELFTIRFRPTAESNEIDEKWGKLIKLAKKIDILETNTDEMAWINVGESREAEHVDNYKKFINLCRKYGFLFHFSNGRTATIMTHKKQMFLFAPYTITAKHLNQNKLCLKKLGLIGCVDVSGIVRSCKNCKLNEEGNY